MICLSQRRWSCINSIRGAGDLTALSNKDRQRALRQRRRGADLIRLEVWVPKNMVAKVRKYAERLKRSASEPLSS